MARGRRGWNIVAVAGWDGMKSIKQTYRYQLLSIKRFQTRQGRQQINQAHHLRIRQNINKHVIWQKASPYRRSQPSFTSTHCAGTGGIHKLQLRNCPLHCTESHVSCRLSLYPRSQTNNTTDTERAPHDVQSVN